MVSIKNKLASLCFGIALSLGTISGITAFSTMNKSNKALAIGETYQRLESVSDINSSASYVLGVEGTGFHTSGTSSWGITKLPTQSPPLLYTLEIVDAVAKTFTAKTTISSNVYYLTVPTSNNFSMSTTSTTLLLGTTHTSGDAYCIANTSTTTRHIRLNGSSGLRSYASGTGSKAYFYEVINTSSEPSIKWNAAPTSASINDSISYSVTATNIDDPQNITWSSSNPLDVFSSSNGLSTDITFKGETGNRTITVSYGELDPLSVVVSVAAMESKIKSVSAIQSGKYYYIGATVGGTTDCYFNASKSSIDSSGSKGVSVTSLAEATPFLFTGSGSDWTLQFNNGNYLYLDGCANSNYKVSNEPKKFSITEKSGLLVLSEGGSYLQRNTNGGTMNFGCYATGSQLNVWLEEKPGVSVNDISISGASSVVASLSVELSAIITPIDADDKSVTWSQSSLDGGLVSFNDINANPVTVTGLNNGTVTITVLSSNPAISSTHTLVVQANSTQSVAISGTMDTHTFTDLDSWSPSGLIVNKTLLSGATSVVTSGITWNYSPATPALMGVGTNQTLTITATVDGVTSAPFTQTVNVKSGSTLYIESDTHNLNGVVGAQEGVVLEAINYSGEVLWSVSANNSNVNAVISEGFETEVETMIEIDFLHSGLTTITVSVMDEELREATFEIYVSISATLTSIEAELIDDSVTYYEGGVVDVSNVHIKEVYNDTTTSTWLSNGFTVSEHILDAGENYIEVVQTSSNLSTLVLVEATPLVVTNLSVSKKANVDYGFNDGELLHLNAVNNIIATYNSGETENVILDGVKQENIKGTLEVRLNSDDSLLTVGVTPMRRSMNGIKLRFYYGVGEQTKVSRLAGVALIINWGEEQTHLSNVGSGAQSFTKVEVEPADYSGEYVLAHINDSGEAVAWTGVEATSCFEIIGVTDNRLDSDPTISVVIEAMEGGYSIRVVGGTNDGSYIYGASSGSNGVRFKNSPELVTIEWLEDGAVKIVSNTNVFSFNAASGQERYRFFKSSTASGYKKPVLFKKSGGTIYSDVSNECVDFCKNAAEKLEAECALLNVTSATWEEIASDYALLSEMDKLALKNIASDPSEANIYVKAFLAKYDYIISLEKYSSLNPFISERQVSPARSGFKTISSSKNISLMLAICSFSLLGFSGYLFIRKKRK